MQKQLTKDELHKHLIEVASQSPAKKRKVGAVIVRSMMTNDGLKYDLISEGYNFNPSGGPCETEDHSTHEDVVHAEVNAINNLPQGFDCYKSYIKLFTTHPPCDGCRAALSSARLSWEVMGDFLKFDSGKPRVALVPVSLIEGVAKVLTYGAKKYKANNWRKTPDTERYISALYRHIGAWQNGEENDPESGLHHLEHAACNIAFLIELRGLPKVQEDVKP